MLANDGNSADDAASATAVLHPISLHHDDDPVGMTLGSKESSLAKTRRRFRAVLNVAATVGGERASNRGKKQHGWQPNIPLGRGGRVDLQLSKVNNKVQHTQGTLLARTHACALHVPAHPETEPTSFDIQPSSSVVDSVAKATNAVKQVRVWAKFTPGVLHNTKEVDAFAAKTPKPEPSVPGSLPGTEKSDDDYNGPLKDDPAAHNPDHPTTPDVKWQRSAGENMKTKKWGENVAEKVHPVEADTRRRSSAFQTSAKAVTLNKKWAKNRFASLKDPTASLRQTNKADDSSGTAAPLGKDLTEVRGASKKKKVGWRKKKKVAPRAHVGWNVARKRINKSEHGTGADKIGGQSFMASPGGSRIAPTGVHNDECNESYDDGVFDGERANRLQTRFDSRNELGILGMWLNSASRSWKRAKEYFGLGSSMKLGNAGVGWLFRSMIKDIGADFGGGVGAFFKFVKYLVVLNFLLFITEMFFVVIPGFVSWPLVKDRNIVHHNLTCSMFNDTDGGGFLPSGYGVHNVSVEFLSEYWKNVTGLDSAFEPVPQGFTMSNYLDGHGIMGYSPIFYGGYVAQLKSGYRTDVAYIVTFGTCTVSTLFFVLRKAYRKDRSVGSIIFKASPTAPFSTGVFSSWDYSLTSINAREALQLGISTSLKDGCAEQSLEAEEENRKKKKLKAADKAEREKRRIENLRRTKECKDLKNKVLEIEKVIHAESFLMKKGYRHPRSDELAIVKETLKLNEMKQRDIRNQKHAALMIILRRVLGWSVWTITLGATFTGCGFIMKLFIAAKEEARENGSDLGLVDEYMLAGTLAAANVVLPLIFAALASFEQYKAGDEITMIMVGRMFVMRIGTIYAVCMALYVELKLNQKHFPPTHQRLWGVQQDCCAGTILGQEAYKLIVTDIFFTNLSEIGLAILQAKLLKRKQPVDKQKMEMDVAQALIFLCYRQGLIWIGMLFAPPLAFLGLVGAALSFYVYYFLAFWAYTTPTALNSRVSSEIFTKALALTFGLTSPILVLITRVWSPNCGPMAGYSTLLSGLEMWSREKTVTGSGDEVIEGESSEILVLLSDPAVLYSVIFLLGFIITVMGGRTKAREEECILQANALDIAHSELESKKNEIFFDKFVAASKVARLQLALDSVQAGMCRSGIEADGAAVSMHDVDVALLDELQCCLTYDGKRMLQQAAPDAILESQDGEWLTRFLTCSAEIRQEMASSWIRNPDGSRNTVMLAVYPKQYASPATWEGLFDQVYKAHAGVWRLAQNVAREMFAMSFKLLEEEATASFLHGYTLAQTYAMGDSNASTAAILQEKHAPLFMSTDRLMHLAEMEEKRLAERNDSEFDNGKLDAYVTPAQLRAWLYLHLSIDADFGAAHKGKFVIGNRSVQDFGDCYDCYDVTDFLDPPAKAEPFNEPFSSEA